MPFICFNQPVYKVVLQLPLFYLLFSGTLSVIFKIMQHIFCPLVIFADSIGQVLNSKWFHFYHPASHFLHLMPSANFIFFISIIELPFIYNLTSRSYSANTNYLILVNYFTLPIFLFTLTFLQFNSVFA